MMGTLFSSETMKNESYVLNLLNDKSQFVEMYLLGSLTSEMYLLGSLIHQNPVMLVAGFFVLYDLHDTVFNLSALLHQYFSRTFLYGAIIPSLTLPPAFFISFSLDRSAPTRYIFSIVPRFFCGKSYCP